MMILCSGAFFFKDSATPQSYRAQRYRQHRSKPTINDYQDGRGAGSQ